MIVVNVHLDSAISTTRDKEIARVIIHNVGETEGIGNSNIRNYRCRSLRGRSKEELDKDVVQRRGVVRGFNREREHVLNLVAKALIEMGYGK